MGNLRKVRFDDPRSAQYNDLPDGVNIEFTPSRNPEDNTQAGFLVFWLIFWLFGGGVAIVSLIFGKVPANGIFFLCFWLVGWFAGLVMVSNHLLTFAFGRKIITIKDNSFQIYEKNGFIEKSKVYTKDRVCDLAFESREKPEDNFLGKIGSMLIASAANNNEIEKQFSITVKCDKERTIIATSDVKEELNAIWNLLKSTGFFSTGKKSGSYKVMNAGQDDIIKAPDDLA